MVSVTNNTGSNSGVNSSNYVQTQTVSIDPVTGQTYPQLPNAVVVTSNPQTGVLMAAGVVVNAGNATVAASRAVPESRTATKLMPLRWTGTNYTATNFGWVTGTSPFVTFQTFMDVETHFDSVAVVYRNTSAVSPLVITKATIAMPTTAADLTGNALTWVPVTFAGGAAGATVPVAVAYGPITADEQYVISDFIPISTLTRTDIPAGRPLVAVRTQLTPVAGTDVISYMQRVSSGHSTYPDSIGRYFAGNYRSTNTDITSGTFGATATAGGIAGSHAGFVYRARSGKVMTIFAFGDSETGDLLSTLGPVWLDKMRTTVSGGQGTTMGTTPVEACYWGYGGTVPTFYKSKFDSLRALTGTGLPFNVCVYQGFSPNVSVLQGQSGNIPYLAEIAAKCISAGIYPITWTGYPSVNITSVPQDNIRIGYNALMSTMDIAVMDFQAAITDNGTGARAPVASILPAYQPGDNLHLNDAGSTVVAAVGATKLAAIATAYFGVRTS